MPPATTKNETVAGTTRCARERSWRSSADMAEPPCDKGRPRRRETPGCADPHSAGAEETSVVDHGGGGAAEDLFAVLVGRDEGQVDQPLRALLPERLRSEEHTSELQSRGHLVCRLLLEKKKKTPYTPNTIKQNKHNNKTKNKNTKK